MPRDHDSFLGSGSLREASGILSRPAAHEERTVHADEHAFGRRGEYMVRNAAGPGAPARAPALGVALARLARNANDRAWETRYNELRRWIEAGCVDTKRSRVCVPIDSGDLGVWVYEQRQLKEKGKLHLEKERRLNELGFVWDLAAAHWEENFQALLEWKAANNGDTRVPFNGGKHCLGAWVVAQRQTIRDGKMNAEWRERLDSIGFFWHSSDSGYVANIFSELDNMLLLQLLDLSSNHDLQISEISEVLPGPGPTTPSSPPSLRPPPHISHPAEESPPPASLPMTPPRSLSQVHENPSMSPTSLRASEGSSLQRVRSSSRHPLRVPSQRSSSQRSLSQHSFSQRSTSQRSTSQRSSSQRVLSLRSSSGLSSASFAKSNLESKIDDMLKTMPAYTRVVRVTVLESHLDPLLSPALGVPVQAATSSPPVRKLTQGRACPYLVMIRPRHYALEIEFSDGTVCVLERMNTGMMLSQREYLTEKYEKPTVTWCWGDTKKTRRSAVQNQVNLGQILAFYRQENSHEYHLLTKNCQTLTKDFCLKFMIPRKFGFQVTVHMNRSYDPRARSDRWYRFTPGKNAKSVCWSQLIIGRFNATLAWLGWRPSQN